MPPCWGAQSHSSQRPRSEPKAQDAKANADAARREELLARYFALSDLDDSTWISFREASATMGISKAKFRELDDNKDGRFLRAEFDAHHDEVLQWLGAFSEALPAAPKPAAKAKSMATSTQSASSSINPFADALDTGSSGNLDLRKLFADAPLGPAPSSHATQLARPTSKPRAPRASYPSPNQMLTLFDRDHSSGLSRREVKKLLHELRAPLSADVIVDRTDHNSNGELEANELGPLAFIVARRLPADGYLGLGSRSLSAVDKLQWNKRDERLALPLNGLQGAQQLTHFHLLDSDGDGLIDSQDLRKKLVQSHSSVRASAIISALDSNGDGSIDHEEFLVALRGSH